MGWATDLLGSTDSTHPPGVGPPRHRRARAGQRPRGAQARSWVYRSAAGPTALRAARDFYASAFGWTFAEYGDAYADTPGSGVTLGLNAILDGHQQRGPLTVLYVADLGAARQSVIDAGGTILHDVYPFPGGRRFHFVDPAGNELAAWSQDPGA